MSDLQEITVQTCLRTDGEGKVRVCPMAHIVGGNRVCVADPKMPLCSHLNVPAPAGCMARTGVVVRLTRKES